MYSYFVIPLVVLCSMYSAAEEFYYRPFNVTHTAPAPFAAYRSALTLDWLAAEDLRQREMAAAFETPSTPPPRLIPMECISYPRPSSGKVARLLLELLKNLEGDDGLLIPELIQALIKSRLLLVETSIFEAEPDLETLVKTPRDMLGEPLSTFPRIMAMVWLSVTDPVTRKHGWCAVNKVAEHLTAARPNDIARNMKALEPILARARFIMEDFIHQVTPLNMMNRPTPIRTKRPHLIKNYEEEDAHPDNKIKNQLNIHSVKQVREKGQESHEDSPRLIPPTMNLLANHDMTAPNSTLAGPLMDDNDMSLFGYSRSLRLYYSALTIMLTMLIFL